MSDSEVGVTGLKPRSNSAVQDPESDTDTAAPVGKLLSVLCLVRCPSLASKSALRMNSATKQPVKQRRGILQASASQQGLSLVQT